MTTQASREAIMLLRHGTRTCALSAWNILQAAERDIRVKAGNAERAALRRKTKEQGLPVRHCCDPAPPFAFAAEHVRKAEDARDLLRRAVEDVSTGQLSDRVDTVRLYSDIRTLREALRLAGGDRQ